MYTALLEQLDGVCHSGMLHYVRNAGNQLQIGNDKYPHTRLRNMLQHGHSTE